MKIWGLPDFIHRRWDLRAQREIWAHDTVVFATGDDRQEPARVSADDLNERWLTEA